MVDYSYNSKLDILVIDKEDREPEQYEETVVVGEYNIDIDSHGNFLGLELLNATQNLPYDKEQLESIEKVEVEEKERSGSTTLSITLYNGDREGVLSVGYPSSVEA